MKKLYSLLAMASLVLFAMPAIFATSVGSGVGVNVATEKFPPRVWMCDNRIVTDDPVQPGRVSPGSSEMVERINNYAFEGESIQWKILVMDKNGIEKLKDVFMTIGDTQGAGNDIEANCKIDEILPKGRSIDPSCNARIEEEKITQVPDDNMMAYYTCQLTVETPDSMYGEYWVTVEAVDLDDLSGTMDENEYWFFNPVIALNIDGDISFDEVRPGSSAYSDTILVSNAADEGSGVMMDMFISGTNFYDSSSSGAKCPTTNELSLSTFRYFATNGAYSSGQDLVQDGNTYDPSTQRNMDPEGYINIQYGDHWDKSMYHEAEILQAQLVGPYYTANLLAPGADMALTLKLDLPEPCNGDFDTGKIFFWGEAI